MNRQKLMRLRKIENKQAETTNKRKTEEREREKLGFQESSRTPGSFWYHSQFNFTL